MSNTDQALKEKILRIMNSNQSIWNESLGDRCAEEIVDLINEQPRERAFQLQREFQNQGNDFGKGMMEVIVPSLNTLLRRLENALEEDK